MVSIVLWERFINESNSTQLTAKVPIHRYSAFIKLRQSRDGAIWQNTQDLTKLYCIK